MDARLIGRGLMLGFKGKGGSVVQERDESRAGFESEWDLPWVSVSNSAVMESGKR